MPKKKTNPKELEKEFKLEVKEVERALKAFGKSNSSLSQKKELARIMMGFDKKLLKGNNLMIKACKLVDKNFKAFLKKSAIKLKKNIKIYETFIKTGK